MTTLGWNRETQTLVQRQVWPDCDICGAAESARVVIMYHDADLGIPSGTTVCASCKRAEARRLRSHQRLFTIPAPSWFRPRPWELPAEDFQDYCAAFNERRHRPRKLLRPVFESLPARALTTKQRRWDAQHWEDHMDDLEFDRMATE